MSATAPRVLLVTSEWPSPEHPNAGIFIQREVDCLRAAGAEIEVFAFRGRQQPGRYLAAWRELRRRFDLRQFDLLHAEFGQSGLVVWPAPRPLVITFQGSDLQGILGPDGRYTLAGRLLQRLSRALARRASEVIVVAEHLKNYLPVGVTAHVIPGGVDFERFRPLDRADARRALGLPPGRRLVLFAANPANPVKRFGLAQAALERLDPALNAELLTVSGRPHEQIPLYMNAADALLLTSRHEGSPNVVKEALACDLPVVSVDVGDVRSHLARVPGCALCADDRPETIAQALGAVLAAGQRVRGRAAIADLDERVIARRVLAVYAAALRRGAARPGDTDRC
jgi:glycosyltransferase involved in cell wall biosynthesis